MGRTCVLSRRYLLGRHPDCSLQCHLEFHKGRRSHLKCKFSGVPWGLFYSVCVEFQLSSKIYDKRDDFDFDIVNFPFLDGDVPRRASYGVYISQLIRFARVCNHVTDFNARNKCLTAKLL